jgi:hypothetical protein
MKRELRDDEVELDLFRVLFFHYYLLAFSDGEKGETKHKVVLGFGRRLPGGFIDE